MARSSCSNETGLLPHVNPGLMTRDDIALLRQRLGLARHHAGERAPSGCASAAARISARRTRCRPRASRRSRAAGEAARAVHDRASSSASAKRGASASRRCSRCATCTTRYGHIQEIIIQNFRPKPGTRMARTPPAAARRSSVDDRDCAADLFEPEMNIQAPPNLSAGALRSAHRRRHQRLGRRVAGDARPRQSGGAVAASRCCWRSAHAAAGKVLVERLAIYPAYARAMARWVDRLCISPCCVRSMARALPRDRRLVARARSPIRRRRMCAGQRGRSATRRQSLARSRQGCSAAQPLDEGEIVASLPARGAEFSRGLPRRRRAARRGERRHRQLRRHAQHQLHQYLLLQCQFCAFSKGKTQRQPARPAV